MTMQGRRPPCQEAGSIVDQPLDALLHGKERLERQRLGALLAGD